MCCISRGKRYRDRIDKFYKEMLKKDLPIYMIPTEYIKTNAIPLIQMGKRIFIKF